MTNIQVILFAGGYRFGRCPMDRLGPTVFWPVGSRTAIEGLMARLAGEGIEEVVLYSDCQLPLSDPSLYSDLPLRVRFVQDPEVSGSGGMLRLSGNPDCDGRIVILPANAVNLPPIRYLIDVHQEGKGELTVFLNPESLETLSEIYVCEASILEHIPDQGYWDIKERVIPELAVLKKRVHRAVLPKNVGCFHDRAGYLQSVSENMEGIIKSDKDLRLLEQDDSKQIWVEDPVEIDPSAKICGTLVALKDTSIGKGTLVIGPTIVGHGTAIGEACTVINSILWDRVRVGNDCEIRRCVMGHNAALSSGMILEDETVVSSLSSSKNVLKRKETATAKKEPLGIPYLRFAGLAVLTIVFLWSFWPQLRDLWRIWQRSDEYSSGLLVPFLAAYVLWCRREDLKNVSIQPCLWGLVLWVLAQGMRIGGLYYMYGFAERLSFILTAVALLLWLAGTDLFRRIWPIMAFLLLMLPWPNRVQSAIALPLQGWSTSSAVFGLELIGYDVIQEGNVIHIGDTSVAVAEACNGLRMITAFFVISGLVVLLVRRPWWEKLIVFISSLPIALICNTLRLAITSMAFTKIKETHWQGVFHDFGGYAMMPLALAMVVGELWMLRKLTTLPTTGEKVSIIRRTKEMTR